VRSLRSFPLIEERDHGRAAVFPFCLFHPLPSTDGSGPPAPGWVENDLNENNRVRPIINLPPRHLKSLLASIAFPAWCLGHDPSAQILWGYS
jgi:hypothetical protein